MTTLNEPRPATGPDTAEAPPRPAAHRPGAMLDSLTGLRGLAAILVFCFHFTTFEFVFSPSGGLTFASLTRPRFLTMSGNFAVGSFFILSGFVLAMTTREGTSMANFCAKRIGKLCPVYLVTTVIAVVAILLIGMPVTVGNIALHLTLLQSWVPYQDIYTGINPVTWSLSTEVFFYLLFPFALFLVRRLRTRTLFVLLAGVVVAEFVVPLYAMHFFTVLPSAGHETYFNTASNGGDLVYWLTLPFPPYRFLEFLSGMICCLLVTRRAVPRIPLSVAWGVGVVAYVIGTYSPGPLQRTAVGLVPLSLLVMALAQADFAGRRSLLRRRLFVTLGKLSYGMYAIQLLVFLPSEPFVLKGLGALTGVSAATLHDPLWRIPIGAAYFAFIAVLAMPIYRYIEVPAYDYAKRLYRSRPPSELFANDVRAREAA